MGPLGILRFLCQDFPLQFFKSWFLLSPPPLFNQVSLESGIVLNFDVRALPSNLETPSPSRFTLAAHDGPASALDVNPHLKGCIVTGGADKLVKVWNIQDNEDTGKRNVSLVTSRDLGVVRFSEIRRIVLYLTNLFFRAKCSRPSGHPTIP